MRTSESIANIAPALVTAQWKIAGIGMSGKNTHDGYKYATLIDYIEAVKPILAELRLALLNDFTIVYRTESDQKKRWVHIAGTYRIIHDSGEWVEGDIHGESCDMGMGDKAIWKAVTGFRKYMIASALNLATTDDPERSDFNKPEKREKSTPPTLEEAQEMTEGVIDDNPFLDGNAFKRYLGDTCTSNGWKKAELFQMIKANFPDFPPDPLKMKMEERREIYDWIEKGIAHESTTQ